MSEVQDIGRELFELLGCTIKQIDCNNAVGRWTAVYPDGHTFNICAETEAQAISYAAHFLCHVNSLQFFPRGLDMTIEIVGSRGRMNIDGTFYGDIYPLYNLGDLVAHALLDYLKAKRVGI